MCIQWPDPDPFSPGVAEVTMSESNSMASAQARYWNEEGGRRWVANIARLERMLAPLAEGLLVHAAPGAGEQVLDVGCGGGPTSAAFAEAVAPGGAVLGVDVSAPILAVANSRYAGHANLHFAQGDAGRMPFPAGSFDLVTSRFGVMFFPDPVGAFTHLRAALKPSGRLRFICWRALPLNPWMALPVQAAFAILPRPEPQPPTAPGPFAFADEGYLRGILAAAGYAQIGIEAHDALLDLGPMDEAVVQMTHMGPAAQAFEQADASTQASVTEAVRAVLQPHLQDGRIRLAGATWLVTAQPG
jgi:SAM-dependent methyltransferase